MAKRIETSRLFLDPVTRAQLPGLHRLWSDPQASFWSLRGCSTSLEESEKWMEGVLNDPDKPDRLSWGVYLSDNQETSIGMVNLWIKKEWEPGHVEPGQDPVWVVAYIFLPEYWGKGYATESLEAMIHATRTVLQPCTLQAYINPANPPSASVAKKCGFELAEKIYHPERPRVFVGGEWREYDVWRFIRKIDGDEGGDDKV